MKTKYLLIAVVLAILSKASAQAQKDTLWCQKVGAVSVVKFTPDGKSLIAGIADNTIRIYDAQSGLQKRIINGAATVVNGLDIDSACTIIAIANATNSVNIYDYQSGILIKALNNYSNQQSYIGVTVVALSKTGNLLAAAIDHYVQGISDHVSKIFIWNTQNWSIVDTLEPLKDVADLSFSPDGKTLAVSYYSLSKPTTIDLFETTNWNSIGQLGLSNMSRQICFSPDGNYLAVACDDGTATIWSMADKSLYKTFNCIGQIWSLSYSSDGKYLVTNSNVGGTDLARTYIWNIETNQFTYYYVLSWIGALYGLSGGDVALSLSIPQNDSMIAAAGSLGIYILNSKWTQTSVANPINITQNTVYPNPVSNIANISYGITIPGMVNVTIYDTNSNLLSTLVNRFQDIGNYTVQWNVANMANGVYYCVIILNNFSSTLTIIVNK